jgi:prepilin-type processing-associated H-X9-DG protein
MKRREAFTLTELLVLIAAGAMFSAVMIASLDGAKDKAQAAVCASNLRQIGVAISMYANDHNDYYPPGYTAGGLSDWPLIIGPYLGKPPTTYAQTIVSSRAFLCPSGVQPGANNGLPVRLMYSAHRVLMPSSSEGYPFYRRSRAARASEVVLVADGVQQTHYYAGEFDAAANFDHVSAAIQFYCPGGACPAPPGYFGVFPGAVPDLIMSTNAIAGDNADDEVSVGKIRFRHSGNTVANFLFCDGHVSGMALGQVKFRNLYFDP